MIKKGILLAGGLGTRMNPITKSVNKQLLPIYDKPVIYYSLSILMMAKIKDILIIVNKGQSKTYKKLLPNGKNLGIKIKYKEQPYPKGLPDAFILGKKFIGKNNVALILGDNFFYGNSLKRKLKNSNQLKNGAEVFLHKVKNPHLFGVAKINSKNQILGIKEKPKKRYSNLAITGLYFFDSKVVELSKKLKPSTRGELEITDLLKMYLNKKELYATSTGRIGLMRVQLMIIIKLINLFHQFSKKIKKKLLVLKKLLLKINGYLKNTLMLLLNFMEIVTIQNT